MGAYSLGLRDAVSAGRGQDETADENGGFQRRPAYRRHHVSHSR
jgi:hypothetical protein